MNNMTPDGEAVFKDLLERAGGAQPGTQGQSPFASANAPLDPVRYLAANLERMGEFVGYMQQAISELSFNYQTLAMMTDVARHHMGLLTNIMVEQKLITEEEFSTRYKTEVTDVVAKIYEEAQKQHEEAMKQQEGGCSPEACGGCEGSCPSSAPPEEEEKIVDLPLDIVEDQEACSPCEDKDCTDCTDEPILASERAALIDAEKEKEEGEE